MQSKKMKTIILPILYDGLLFENVTHASTRTVRTEKTKRSVQHSLL